MEAMSDDGGYIVAVRSAVSDRLNPEFHCS